MTGYERDLMNNIYGSLSRALELNLSMNKSMHWLVMPQLTLSRKIMVVQPQEFS